MKVNEVLTEAPNAARDIAKMSKQYDKRAREAAPLFAGSLLREIYDLFVAAKEQNPHANVPFAKIKNHLENKFEKITRVSADEEGIGNALRDIANRIFRYQTDEILTKRNRSEVAQKIYPVIRQALSNPNRGERKRSTDTPFRAIASKVNKNDSRAQGVHIPDDANTIIQVRGHWYFAKYLDVGPTKSFVIGSKLDKDQALALEPVDSRSASNIVLVKDKENPNVFWVK